ncbi:Rz1-like lysis system protein LysC [Cohaesibacter intestini]|uniref:Rz1-like lysis system protein LysC n=1 Tax=Cohaesibacter intestini TaxID=2211145 RepID=UPI001300A7E6|nr:hypothetical protein [Cohaesibacter intestini]
MLASSLMMTLAGCKSSGELVAAAQLPPMPADLQRQCADPGVQTGRDARAVIARHRQSLAECRNRHRDTVQFYKQVRGVRVRAGQ